MRRTRRNTIWLVLLSILMTLVVISPNIQPAAQAVLLGLFLLAMGGTILDTNVRQRLLKGITERVSARQNRVSPQAREARERAEQRGSYIAEDLDLIDIGVIVAQSGSDGLVMRRARSMSKDDDGARPFITLFVPPHEAERNANVRFEFIDQDGEQRYVHQNNIYLRDGEMNILADHHMPLFGNDDISGMGDWDLRVYVNNVLVGLHSFQMTASVEERRGRVERRRTRDEDDQVRRRLTDERRDAPMSLEDLLRGQDEANRGGR